VDLTAPFRGVKVSLKSQLEHWVEVLEEWCLVHERYCRMAPGDAIFWNGERANVGALAAAAWRAGSVALEEYTLPKQYKQANYHGRADLWLGSTETNDYIEAKFQWLIAPTTERGIAQVAATLDTACQEAASNQVSEPHACRVGLVFCAVYVKKRERRQMDEHVRGCIEATVRIPHGASAWCFPTPVRALSGGRGDDYLYPGIILLARVSTR